MRTSNWTALSALAFALVAAGCGDDGGGDDTNATTTNPTTAPTTEAPTTGSDATTDPTTETPTTTPPPTTENPTTETPTTETPTTVDPTTDPMTDPTTETDTGGDLTCEAYCGIYATACKDFSEYDNEQACLDQCSQWPIGTAGAVDGDSLGCRTYHVTVASQTDPNVHCPHAGPSGDNTCVDPNAPTCEGYCGNYFKNCQNDLNLFDGDMAACMAFCATKYQGIKDETTRDTVGCREYHAGAPALGDPVLHCPHAGPGGADVCVVP
jgi:hypothetical protein